MFPWGCRLGFGTEGESLGSPYQEEGGGRARGRWAIWSSFSVLDDQGVYLTEGFSRWVRFFGVAGGGAKGLHDVR